MRGLLRFLLEQVLQWPGTAEHAETRDGAVYAHTSGVSPHTTSDVSSFHITCHRGRRRGGTGSEHFSFSHFLLSSGFLKKTHEFHLSLVFDRV